MNASNSNVQAQNVTLYPETRDIVEGVNGIFYQGRNFSAALRYIIHDWARLQAANGSTVIVPALIGAEAAA